MTQPPSKQTEENDLPEVAIRVISSLYDSVAEGTPYEPMFFAMDEVINDLLTSSEQDQNSSLWAPMLSPHFDRAAHIFDIMSRQDTLTPLTFVEQQSKPALVVSQSGGIVATNRLFDALPSAPWSDGIKPLFALPADASRFSSLAQANDPAAQAILNLTVPGEDRVISVLAGVVSGLTNPKDDAPLLYLFLIQPRWTEKAGELLQQAFGLTAAEIETLETFVACGSVKGIAERRGRSVRTVRTQLSRVFSQMGISGQTELALFLATFSGLEPVTHTPIRSPRGEQSKSDRLVSKVTTINAKRVEYLEYGAQNGTPVLLLQSSHPPELTVSLRRALYHAGLRIIAPLKPGSGKSEKLDKRPGPEKMAHIYAGLLEQLGLSRVIVAGQASGGLYALTFADEFPASVHGLCLIDTGVPYRDRTELISLPKTIRRTMVPARYFPDLLYLPHRLVAANFHRSSRGEESVVDYFFHDSPYDQELTRTDRNAYDTTRRIISYSFDDTDRLVDDVSRWAGDWSQLLRNVSNKHPVHFIHGSENTMFSADKITEFVASQEQARLINIEGSGQLAVFEHPDRLANSLVELANGPGSNKR